MFGALANRFGMAVVGLVVLGVSLYMLTTSEVHCGSDTMRPGDVCATTRAGSTIERTYDEEKSSQQRMALFGSALGAALLVGGVVRVVLRRRREAAMAAAPTAA
jgi:hypothetical protein